MKNIGIAQSFLLLSVNAKGGVASIGSMRIRAFLIASGILELILDDIIGLSDDQVTVPQKLPQDKLYLGSVYNKISREESISFKKLARELVTDRDLFKETFNAIGDSLVDLGIVSKTNGGLLGNSNHFVGGEESKKHMVEQIRAELLEEGPVTTDTVVMSSLLIGSHALKNYFSKFEEKDLNDKIAKLRQDAANYGIFAMIDGISSTITTIVASVG